MSRRALYYCCIGIIPSLSTEWDADELGWSQTLSLDYVTLIDVRQRRDKKDIHREAVVVMECIHFHVFLQ